MNRPGDERKLAGADAVEALLEQAAPRPAPPIEDERIVRDAVRAEWRRETGRRRARRRYTSFAVAASVLLAIVVTLNTMRGTGIESVEVATIVRSQGSIFLQGGDDRPVSALDVETVFSGQSMTTGDDAVAGLAWSGGGSLRVDKDTRIDFVSADEIYLHSGRVYLDTASSDGDQPLRIETPHATVTHLGTQFMTRTDDTGLTVSVREGRVEIDGRYHDQLAYEGQRVELIGRARPTITNISGTGADWTWIEAASPGFDADGRSVEEFLRWVGRETGYSVEFADAGVEQIARETQLRGSLQGDPRTELRLRMLTMDLNAEFNEETSELLISQ